MQAALWLELVNVLGSNYTVLIEPVVKLRDDRLIRPDIVICKAGWVVSVVELKYLPRGKPSPASDLSKLKDMEDSENISIMHQRYRGPHTGIDRFTLHSKAVYAWASISGRPPALPESGQVPRRYIHLAAVTDRNTGAKAVAVKVSAH